VIGQWEPDLLPSLNSPRRGRATLDDAAFEARRELAARRPGGVGRARRTAPASLLGEATEDDAVIGRYWPR
jgi:hypothetical protein